MTLIREAGEGLSWLLPARLSILGWHVLYQWQSLYLIFFVCGIALKASRIRCIWYLVTVRVSLRTGILLYSSRWWSHGCFFSSFFCTADWIYSNDHHSITEISLDITVSSGPSLADLIFLLSGTCVAVLAFCCGFPPGIAGFSVPQCCPGL